MRRLMALLVPLVILAGVFVVVDRVMAGVAQNRIAEQLQKSQGLAIPPDVTVRGFPFLTQVLRGRYTEIDADLRDPAIEDSLAVERLQVRLHGVRIKVSALTAGDFSSVPVDSATAVGTVTYESLNRAAKKNLPGDGTKVEFSGGDKSQLKISGTYAGSLLSAKIDGQARLVARDGRLVVELEPGALDGVPAAFRSQVAAEVAKASKLPALPMGFQAESVTVGADAVTVKATSDTLNLSNLT